jgi:UDP-N-acetylmuramate--alanine ligase
VTRTSADIGAGLAAPRASRPIAAGERIHILGIAGAGASAAALLARAAGAIVTGCDPGGPSPYTLALEAARIPIEWAHHAAHVGVKPPPDRICVTKALTAIAPDHPELLAAAAAGIPAESWQQLVADAAHGRTLVAVAGTHGKSSTAGWLTWILAEVGLDPSAFVGALLPAALTNGIPATARIGHGAPFVVEADEYAGNFEPYLPDLVTLTTIEWDHPDVFADRGQTIDAFARWLGRAQAATVVANLADDGVSEVLAALQGAGRRTGSVVGASVIGTGSSSAGAPPEALWIDQRVTARVLDRAESGTLLEVGWAGGGTESPMGEPAGTRRVRLPTVGDHNASNALVALATAMQLGDRGGPSGGDSWVDRLLWALSTFPGIGRRLERKGEARGVVVYDDYGHHPTAIRATLEALRQREPDRRIWAVYEPLTFHRTAAMLDAFADALAEADAVAVANIWASRDPDTTITSSEALASAVRARRADMTAFAPGSVEDTAAWLADEVRDGDAVLVMGGGASYRVAELLLEHLASEHRGSGAAP